MIFLNHVLIMHIMKKEKMKIDKVFWVEVNLGRSLECKFEERREEREEFEVGWWEKPNPR